MKVDSLCLHYMSAWKVTKIKFQLHCKDPVKQKNGSEIQTRISLCNQKTVKLVSCPKLEFSFTYRCAHFQHQKSTTCSRPLCSFNYSLLLGDSCCFGLGLQPERVSFITTSCIEKIRYNNTPIGT